MEKPRSLAKKAIKMDPKDNVAVAISTIEKGDIVEVDETLITSLDRIPRGHKIALTDISTGGKIIKYGEVIGIAQADIKAGAHVHVHNVVSARLPGKTS